MFFIGDPEFSRGLEKRPRINETGEDCYLHEDGSVTRDEDKIIKVQRIWKERVYSPPGTVFGPRGKMYQKCLLDFNLYCRGPVHPIVVQDVPETIDK